MYSVLLDVQYIMWNIIWLYVFLTIHIYFKRPLKNNKEIIPEDVFDVILKCHNIMNNHSCSKTTYHQLRLPLLPFLQEFSVSVRSDSDSRPFAMAIEPSIYTFLLLYVGHQY